MGKSRVLVIGPMGNFGHVLASASLSHGHPTFGLVRPKGQSSSPPDEKEAEKEAESEARLHSLKSSGLKVVVCCIKDHENLLKAIKMVDVVISAVNSSQIMDQKHVIEAVKVAGCIKRFIPSEFGSDPEKVDIPDRACNFHEKKAEIRKILKEESIPYTCILCNYFSSFLLPSLIQPELKSPPTDKVLIFGDGSTKAIFVKESDVANFTVKVIDDPRTRNKIVYLRPKGNVYSQKELVQLWESKTGVTLEKVYMNEDQLLESIREKPYPANKELVFIYSAFIKGDHTNFDIGASGVEGTELYPDLKYTTISEYLDSFL